MKQVLYIANMRLPSERAHSVHVMEMCAALSSANGGNVFLLVPTRHTDVKTDEFSYYGVPRTFEIVRVKSFDAFRFPIPSKWAYYIHALSFVRAVLKKIKDYPDALVLSRDLYSAYGLAKQGRKVAFEVHDLPSMRAGRMLKEIPFIITTNNWKKEQLIKQFNVDPRHIQVAPNAVDFKKFSISPDAVSRLHQELNWSRDKKVVLYTGSLYPWKGVETLALASQYLNPEVAVIFIGGGDQDRKEFLEFLNKKNLSNRVSLLPHRPHGDIPSLLASANVLVLPTSAKGQMGNRETSPIKAFEYLCAQKPIVASNVPSSREILDKTLAIFFRPDDPQDCARAITQALNKNYDGGMIDAQNAFIQNHTWVSRAKNVLNFLSI